MLNNNIVRLPTGIEGKTRFRKYGPFNHIVIENFFDEQTAAGLVKEFPEYDSPTWHTTYDNPVEKYKRTCNHWDRFPKTTYRTLAYLNSPTFLNYISELTGIEVYPDVGLHGGGWHTHKTGGSLNVHKDYSIHPKLGLERRLNLIVYLTPDWKEEWGGGLELWSNDPETNQPKECAAKLVNKFNRAVLFDTTQDSWHGLPDPITCPEGIYRQSLAVYYLSYPRSTTDIRSRALFAPREDQKNNQDVLDLIKERAKPVEHKS